MREMGSGSKGLIYTTQWHGYESSSVCLLVLMTGL